jgi:hypothetical protein
MMMMMMMMKGTTAAAASPVNKKECTEYFPIKYHLAVATLTLTWYVLPSAVKSINHSL